MTPELTSIAPHIEGLARALLGDCLLRSEEAPEEEALGLGELLRPFRQCLKSVEMNICVVGTSPFRTCLLKHSRLYFSRSTRGGLLAEEFVTFFAGMLLALGDGDEELGRMRLSLYQGEIGRTLSGLVEEGQKGLKDR